MSEGELPLQGKVAVITGASSGIGKAAALSWASLGADVVVCARTATPAPGVLGSLSETKETIESMGRRCLSVRADMAQEADIENLAKETFREFDRVDIVLNNAAALDSTGMNASFWDMTSDEWNEQVAVNLNAPWLVMKQFVPSMRDHGGLVINMTSGAIPGEPIPTGLPGQGYPGATYMVTKVALDRMTADLSRELEAFGIAVIALHPGRAMAERTEPLLIAGGHDVTQWRPMEEAIIPSLRWLVTNPNPMEYTGTVLFAPLLVKEHSLV